MLTEKRMMKDDDFMLLREAFKKKRIKSVDFFHTGGLMKSLLS